jgi:hypothetical protein
MSTATVELPDSLKTRIEALAAKEGYSVSQFLASAAGEKLAAMLTMDYLRREASAGRRDDFEKYLAAVPDVAPPEDDRLNGDAVPLGEQPAKKRNGKSSKRAANKSTKSAKSVAASALTQAANKRKRKKG